MGIPVVPPEDPDQSRIEIVPIGSPYSLSWWTSQTITQIPKDAVGWLVAQGWQITDINYDESTVPPEPYYSMSRQSLQNWQVLQSLLNSYTIAYNDARHYNNERYNEVVEDWTEMLSSSQWQFDAQVGEQNTHAALYLGNLDTYMSQVESLVSANSAAIDAAVAEIVPLMDQADGLMAEHAEDYDALVNALLTDYDSYVTDFSAVLDLLPTDYGTYADEFNVVLDLLPTDYDTHVADFGGELDLLPTNYATHTTAFNDVLDLLPTDHATHSAAAAGYLVNLGTTELARINEAFAATLAVQLQSLMDRGMSSSDIIDEITERNARDRDEQVGALNDRLSREHLENQHRVYEQQVAVRNRTLDGRDRLFDRQTTMRSKILDGKDRLFNQQTAMRSKTLDGKGHLFDQQTTMRSKSLDGEDRLYERQAEMRNRTLAGKDRLQGLRQEILRYRVAQTMQNAEAELTHKHRAVAELMSVYAARLQGLQGKHAENMTLMAYQLDERNKLLIGLYGFVEGRDDIGPEFSQLTQLATSLGDAGGGWVTP